MHSALPHLQSFPNDLLKVVFSLLDKISILRVRVTSTIFLRLIDKHLMKMCVQPPQKNIATRDQFQRFLLRLYNPQSIWGFNFKNQGIFKASVLQDLPQHIMSLDLTSCFIDNSVIPKLPTSLVQLNLSSCTHLSEKGYQSLNRFSQLQHLNLSSCKKISFETIANLPSGLQHLVLNDCRMTKQKKSVVLVLTGEDLKLLPPHLTSLELVNLRLYPLDKDILDNLPSSLKTLDLTGAKCTRLASSIPHISVKPKLT